MTDQHLAPESGNPEETKKRSDEWFVYVDLAALRRRLGLSQPVFARTYGLALSSFRHWEQGNRVPEKPINLYLCLIERHPDLVAQAVHPILAAHLAQSCEEE